MSVGAKFRSHFIQKAEDDSHRTIHMSPVTADTPEKKTGQSTHLAVCCRCTSPTQQHSNSSSWVKSTSSIFSQLNSHSKAHLRVGLIMLCWAN